MSMYELTQIILRRRWLVAAAALLLAAVGTVFVVVEGGGASYTARAQVIVDQPALVGAVDGQNITTKLNAFLPTLCGILDGDAATGQVAARTSGSATHVRSTVNCRPQANTTIADIDSTTSSAGRSQRLTAAAADVLVATINDRYDTAATPPANRIEASILVAAKSPSPNPHHTARQLGLVAVGALFVAIAFAVAAEPHRRDGVVSSQLDPSIVWIPMAGTKVESHATIGNGS
jgi:capsular polysaccharide biosynthesis protein